MLKIISPGLLFNLAQKRAKAMKKHANTCTYARTDYHLLKWKWDENWLHAKPVDLTKNKPNSYILLSWADDHFL